MCNISDSIQLEVLLQKDAEITCTANEFIAFFSLLDEHFLHDIAAMAHCIRKPNAALQTTPLLAMVNQGMQKEVIIELQVIAYYVQ